MLLVFLLWFTAHADPGVLRLFALKEGAPERSLRVPQASVRLAMDGSLRIDMALTAPPLTFQAREGDVLVKRTYEDARAYPEGNPRRPRMDVSLAPCEEAGGAFQVRALDLRKPEVAIDFVKTCHGKPVLAGAFRMHSDLPVPTSVRLDPAPPEKPNPVRQVALLASEPGDYVGRGRTWHFDGDDAVFRLTQTAEGARLIIQGDSTWEFTFSAPAGQELALGRYPRASGDSLRGPGLSVTGDGRGCNAIKGEFEVRQLRPLALDFVQYCEETMPPLRGSIRLGSDVPLREFGK